MITEPELIAAVAAAPDDDAPRLVYADWLSDRGDPRGELIHLQVQLARAEADDVLLPNHDKTASRAHAVLTQNKKAWTKSLRDICNAVYDFQRGFVERITKIEPVNFGGIANKLCDAAPLLRAATIKTSAVASINVACRRFHELRFYQPILDEGLLAQLATTLEGGSLRSVHFETPYLSTRAAANALAAWPVPVEHFGLTMQYSYVNQLIGRDYFARILAGRDLRSLSLAAVREPELGMLNLDSLEALELRNCFITWNADVPRKLFEAMPKLTSIVLAAEQLQPAHIEALLTLCPRLRRATFDGVWLDATSLRLLAAAKHLRRLDFGRLDLSVDTMGKWVDELLTHDLSHLTSLTLSKRLPENLRARVVARHPHTRFR